MAENPVRRWLSLLLLASLLGVGFIGECLAHDLGLARILLTRLSDQSVQLEAKLPTGFVPSKPQVAVLHPRLGTPVLAISLRGGWAGCSAGKPVDFRTASSMSGGQV